MRVLIFALAGIAATSMAAPGDPTLELVASGFSQPLAMAQPPGETERLFVVEQDGLIRLVGADGQIADQPFLDLTAETSSSGERGLLGLAFPPDFATSGHFYVNYTSLGSTFSTVIARYSVSNNPDIADPNSAVVLLTIDQPFGNHNGGDIHFDSQGLLYIGMGDGGGGGDPVEAGQNVNTLLGKMLRIDPTPGGQSASQACGPEQNYSIPADNPYFGGGGCGEIWTVGMRNPFRFTIDPQTDNMIIGDVGQSAREEIDLVPAGMGGLNMGWDCREGLIEYPNESQQSPLCDTLTSADFTDPIVDYERANGRCSVTGGVVNRTGIPGLTGRYFFGDFCSGEIFVLSDPTGPGTLELFTAPMGGYCTGGGCLTGFGQDQAGQTYVIDRNGQIFLLSIELAIFADGFESQ